MGSIAKRLPAASFAFFFAVWSVLFPVTVQAATYNASSSLNGNVWVVAGQSTPLAGVSTLATAASVLGKASPWITGLTIGTQVFGYLLENGVGNKMAIVPSNGQVANNLLSAAKKNASDLAGETATFSYTKAYGCSCNNGTYTASAPTARGVCDAIAGHAAQCGCTVPGTNTPVTFFTTSSDDTSCTVGSTPNGYGGGFTPTKSCAPGKTLYADGLCHLQASSASQPLTTSEAFPGADAILQNNEGTFTQAPTKDQTAGLTAPQTEPIPVPNQPANEPATVQVQPKKDGGIEVTTRKFDSVNNETTINNLTINSYGYVTNSSSTVVPSNVVNQGTSQQLPTDYNRESTQQAVNQKLDDIKTGAGAPDHSNFAQSVEQQKAAMEQAIQEKLDALPSQYAGDKSNWFSWVWTPPVGECSPWSSTIHGQTVSWDVCPYVAKIRDTIGFLLAVFGAWVVYTEMFRREES